MPHAAVGRALALLAALASLGAGAQTMYKWVDEKGTTHFSEHPPPDAKTEMKATKVTPKVTPPTNPAAYDPNAWKAKESEARKRRVDSGVREKTDTQDREKRAATCERARSRLAFLQNSSRIFRDNPDGTRSYMDDAQRDAEVARARQTADESCR